MSLSVIVLAKPVVEIASPNSQVPTKAHCLRTIPCLVQVVDGSNWQLRLSGNIGHFHEWFFHMNLLAERLSLCTSLTLLQTDDSWIRRLKRLRFLLMAGEIVSRKVFFFFLELVEMLEIIRFPLL